ncbi:MAG: calcineurin-like phosphoesterase family protein [Candidatus Marinimicrobia bacterium]|nr:calcineurin-like phosphoesterase family protein [Candidatus Neomarinimicrobiota bacterium]
MKKINLFISLLFFSTSFSQVQVKGIVFNDRNQNGLIDRNEPGIGGQRISNGMDIVLTDRKGHFKIEAEQNDVIFLTKPANWDIPTNKFGIPQFFYNVRTDPSPEHLKYKAFDAPLPLETVYFPMVQTKPTRKYRAIISGDPQPRDSTEIDYYRDEIIAPMLLEEDMAFYVPLGDIMYDDLSLYPYYLEQVGTLGIPVWHVFGNHDLNYRAKNDTEAHETWHSFFGPDYYSFEYGDVHFIALNTVYYKGWNTAENKRGDYLGALTEAQLAWLENDLKYVSKNDRIVLLSHIPIISEVYAGERVEVTNRDALYGLLKEYKYLLALGGHMHFIENMYLDESHGWHEKTLFQNMILGAACGAWWYGPLQANGTPYGYHYDGSPNGYFTFSFNGDDYNYRYHTSINQPESSFRISAPVGRITSARADTMMIVLNIFYGSSKTQVIGTLDGHRLDFQKQYHAQDPYMNRVIKENPDRFPERETMPISNHIWMATTGGMEKGQHKIWIKVLNENGVVEKQVRIFEVY